MQFYDWSIFQDVCLAKPFEGGQITAGAEFLRFGNWDLPGRQAGNPANSANSDHGFDTNVIMSQSCYHKGLIFSLEKSLVSPDDKVAKNC